MRLIDADALMKECAKFVAPSNNSDFADVPTWNDAISLIGSAPTIEERKTGRWIDETVTTGTTSGVTTVIRQYRCSVCGNLFGRIDDRYCGKCGAKMEGESK